MADAFALPTAARTAPGAEHRRSHAGTPGILRRFLLALMDARQRQADREVAAILMRRGRPDGE